MDNPVFFLILILCTLVIGWANERNQCPDCGEQLKWVDPDRMDLPLTRCFTCDGPHPAYIRPEYHDEYGF